MRDQFSNAQHVRKAAVVSKGGIVASQSRAYSGLLSCRNAQGVPISFSIEQVSAAVARRSEAGK